MQLSKQENHLYLAETLSFLVLEICIVLKEKKYINVYKLPQCNHDWCLHYDCI
jgi:hypothetical protein